MIKLLRSKKAQESEELPAAAEYTIYFMIVAILLSLGAISLVVITSTYQVKTTAILGNLESSIMEYGLLNSPECFAYQDQLTKRIYPHVIDIEKFTNERLSGCISPVSAVCLRAELKIGEKVVAFVKSPNYKSPGNVRVDVWPVRIKNKDEEKQGFMAISTSKTCT